MSALEAAILAVGLSVDIVLAFLPVVLWLWFGRDPHFTDDDSVLMPSPPSDLSPALAALLLHGSPTRQVVAAGLMDLASHDLISFTPEPGFVFRRAGLSLTSKSHRRKELNAPEADLYGDMEELLRVTGHLSSIFLSALTPAFGRFTRQLDDVAVKRGWFRWNSGALVRAWRVVAGVEFFLGLAIIGWISSAGTLIKVAPIDIAAIGLGLEAGGVVTYSFSASMPARTTQGAILSGWLRAYRRTLKAAIAQASSLEQIVELKPLPWVGTPTEEIAWAVAFGLHQDIDHLLAHSLELSETGGWPAGISDWFSVM